MIFRKRKKLFCIGCHKTGTTTLRLAANILGYRACGRADKREIRRALLARDFEAVDRLLARSDIFETGVFCWPDIGDGKTPFYQLAFERCPDSVFALTVRKDTASWKRSLETQLKRKRIKLGLPDTRNEDLIHIYGADTVASDDFDAYARVYESHNEAARAFFAKHAPERFAEFCWENGDGWEKLCRLTSCRKPIFRSFPHANDSRRKAIQITPASGA